MSFKKYLRSPEQKGQATLEYFILFSVLIVLTLISVSSLMPRVQGDVVNNVQSRSNPGAAMARVVNADNQNIVLGLVEGVLDTLGGFLDGFSGSLR